MIWSASWDFNVALLQDPFLMTLAASTQLGSWKLQSNSWNDNLKQRYLMAIRIEVLNGKKKKDTWPRPLIHWNVVLSQLLHHWARTPVNFQTSLPYFVSFPHQLVSLHWLPHLLQLNTKIPLTHPISSLPLLHLLRTFLCCQKQFSIKVVHLTHCHPRKLPNRASKHKTRMLKLNKSRRWSKSTERNDWMCRKDLAPESDMPLALPRGCLQQRRTSGSSLKGPAFPTSQLIRFQSFKIKI